jgi:hypothetical protein
MRIAPSWSSGATPVTSAHDDTRRRPPGGTTGRSRAVTPWRLVLAVLYVLLLILSLDNTVPDVVLLTPERDRHAATAL